jgi:hypothetical protein
VSCSERCRGLDIDWETLKHGKSGATGRSQRSKARDRGKSDFRKERKDRGKK